jgi:N,N-dimethylformamidase
MPVPGTVDTTSILGYAWPLAVCAGEEVRFHLSSPAIDLAEATVARVRCADPDPDGPGLKLTFPGTPVDGQVPLRNQPLYPGSCGIVADAPVLGALSGFAVGTFLWPTASGVEYDGATAQTVLARWCESAGRGWRLGLDAEGRPEFIVSDGGQSWRAVSPLPLTEREWVLIGGSWDPATREIRIMVRSLDPQAGRDRSTDTGAPGPEALSWPTDTVLTMAGHAASQGPSPRVLGLFDGKLDRPRLYGAPLPLDALHRLCETLRPAPVIRCCWAPGTFQTASRPTGCVTSRPTGWMACCARCRRAP